MQNTNYSNEITFIVGTAFVISLYFFKINEVITKLLFNRNF